MKDPAQGTRLCVPRVLLIPRAASPTDSSCSPNLLPPGRGWALLGQALVPVLAVSTSTCSRSQNTSPKTKQKALGLLGGCCWAAWGAEFSRTWGQGCSVLSQCGETEWCWGQFPNLSFMGALVPLQLSQDGLCGVHRARWMWCSFGKHPAPCFGLGQEMEGVLRDKT